MKKQWNKDMRDQLKDFPKKAPEGLLDDIKSEMIRRGLSPSPVADKPKRLYPMILRRIASVAAVLLILLGLSHLWEKSATLPVMTEHMETPQNPIHPLSEAQVEVTQEQSLTDLASSLIAQTEKPTSIPLEIPDIEEEESMDKEPAEELQEKNEEKEEEQPQDKDTQEAKKEYVKTSPKPKWTYNVSRRKKSSLTLDAYFSGLVAQAGQKMGNELLENAGPNSPTENPSENPSPGGMDSTVESDSTSTSGGSRALSRGKTENGVRHHLPIKVGFSLRYSSNECWYIQSGLTYSYLATDINRTGRHTAQKLHYIGIPIQVGRQVWESKRFKGYVSGSAQVEKLVSGKATTRKEDGQTSVENIRDKRLLYSALLSVGAEYALNKDVSLYAEPGVHYYFNNGNGLETYYNEHPFNFNLTVGFRFHWKK